LGTLGAEGRVAAFLLSMSARLGALGYSRCSFNLRMTRQEIGSYLGLKLETVSRALSALNTAGFIHVHQRTIDIIDADALRGVIDPTAGVPASTAPHLESASVRSKVNHVGGSTKSRPKFPSGLAWRQFAAA
jgi:CRP/FNR family transcriptional regulator